MRRFPVLVTLAMLFALPQSAAATFGELPFLPVPGVATCLRATGEPGLLSRLAPAGAAILEASRSGLRPAGVVALGAAPDACPLVLGHPGGAAIAATVARVGDHEVLQVATRAPGGDFGAPSTVFIARRASRLGFDAAVAPDGAAVVAARESAEVDTGDGRLLSRTRVVAVRAPAGGAFGAVETIAPWRTAASVAPDDVRAGIDDEAAATVAYVRSGQDPTKPLRATASVVRAAPGSAFGPTAQTLAAGVLSGIALGIAPDGRSIVALTGIDGVRVAERGPQDERFGALSRLTARGGFPRSPSVAVDPGGGAIVAWRPGDDGAAIATRATAGAFSPAVELAASPPSSSGGEFTVIANSVQDADGLDPRPAIVGGGRYVVAWGSSNAVANAPRVASGALGFPPADRGAGAAIARSPQSAVAVQTADGSLGLAWADDTASLGFGRDMPVGGGRLHLALAGAPARPEPAPPQIRVDRPRLQTLRPSGFARLTVTCGGPCDVRAEAPRAAQGVSLTSRRGGRLVARIPLDPFATARTRSLRIVIRGTAPGGARAVTHRLTLPIRIRVPAPLPRPLGIAAHRSGSDVIVTFHVRRPVRRADYEVAAYRNRSSLGLGVAHALVHGRGRGAFRVRLRHAAAGRYVRVVVFSGVDDRARISTPVRIG